MPKQRSPDSYQAEEMYRSGMKLVEIASQLNVSEGTVRSWKNRYEWSATLQKGKRNVAKKKGGQPGNQNATGHGAPRGNQNAKKHGLYSRYLPADVRDLFDALDDADPLDLLWNQIKLANLAIIRAQQIMYVQDQEDVTTTKIEERSGDSSWGEKWEVQQPWDKQATFLQAQARAQAELRSLIKQYDEMLHKRWDLATDEQKARIEQLKANAYRLSKDSNDETDEGVEIVNDAPKEAGEDIRDHSAEVPADLQ